MSRSIRLLAIFVASLAAESILSPGDRIAQAQPAASDGHKQASERFQRGLALYKEANLDAAMVEFQGAYQLSPSYKILYNIAMVQRDQKDYRAALATYERFLSEGGKEVDAGKRREVEKEIATLRGFVGTLEIVTSPPGAQVRVDDESVGASPIAAMATNAGTHRISVTLDGYRDTIETVAVGGKEARRIEVALPPLPKVSPSVIIKTKQEPPSRWDGISFALLGATGALAVGAGITGGFAYAGSRDIQGTTFTGDTATAELESLGERTRALAITTDVLAGSAAAMLAATFIYTYVHTPEAPKEEPPKPAVRVGFSGTGLTLGGTW